MLQKKVSFSVLRFHQGNKRISSQETPSRPSAPYGHNQAKEAVECARDEVVCTPERSENPSTYRPSLRRWTLFALDVESD